MGNIKKILFFLFFAFLFGQSVSRDIKRQLRNSGLSVNDIKKLAKDADIDIDALDSSFREKNIEEESDFKNNLNIKKKKTDIAEADENNVSNNEKINLVVKFDKLLLEIIKANIIIKKGFTNSIGCILGKNNKSIHLFDPLTSTPMIGTKTNKIKVMKKI